jgi:ABC-type bacteriocin/lantibiotic exporter with double-glycine peptidase domain
VIKVTDVLQARSPVVNLDVVEKLNFQSRIELKNISFTYARDSQLCEGTDTVLNDLSLNIEANEITAIVGSSGSGKTTLLHVLLGLLEPARGTIHVDETLITQHNAVNWQRTMSYVPQNVPLADCSILENVAFGLAESAIDIEHVWRCLEAVQLGKFVRNSPAGIDTVVGEMGVEISGGERQRLGIARALFVNPRFVVMDEATSSLDIQTEKNLMKNLQSFSESVSIIMVAHRPATIAFADKVAFVSDGRVQRVLTQSDLEANPNLLAELLIEPL